MENLDAIPYFLAVVKHASFAAASRELGVSRSAVNKRVIQLEESLGVRLLNRTTRKVSLTETGKLFYRDISQAYYWIKKAEDAATSQQSQAIGKLKISAPMSFGRLVIAPLVPGFLKEFPNVHIDMTMNDGYVDIVAEGFDVAIRGGELQDSSMIARKLMTSRSIICASPCYFELTGRSVPLIPQHLEQHNALIYQHLAESTEWAFEQNNCIQTVAVKGNYRVNNSEALLCAVIEGVGIARLPDFVARDYVNSKQLLELLPDYEMPEKNIYALFPQRDFMPIKLRAFLDYLSKSL